MRNLLALAALVALAVPAAGDDAALQLWLDHAVSSSEHVARGRYEGGRLDVTAVLKGDLKAKAIAIDSGEVEPRPADLAPGAPPTKKGDGLFFLQGRFDGKGADARRFIEWQGVQGVAWEGTVTYLGYRSTADDTLALVDLAKRADLDALLGVALAREKALDAALALVDSKARAAKLAELVKTAHDGPEDLVADLGPDPFAQRAIIEIGHAGEVTVLHELRRGAKLAWIKSAAVRALAPTPGGEKLLEAIALDEKTGEDEVVAAIDMLFSTEKASVEALEKLSFDARPRVRRAVASALREKVKDLKVLERLMKDPDPTVRGAATEAARAAARRLELPLPGAKARPDDEEK